MRGGNHEIQIHIVYRIEWNSSFSEIILVARFIFSFNEVYSIFWQGHTINWEEILRFRLASMIYIIFIWLIWDEMEKLPYSLGTHSHGSHGSRNKWGGKVLEYMFRILEARWHVVLVYMTTIKNIIDHD